ncbi:MAG TPA: TonB-dependent receptor, partial [Candidatus Saccharimonadales bacterium]|nr:TonB-dependent receptor [Candidatus Saccharimonadales bacterium]
LSLTGVQNSYQTSAAEQYDFDYDTKKQGAFRSLGQYSKDTYKIWIAKYTSYITDNLTLNAMVGKMHSSYYVDQPAYPGFDPNAANVLGSGDENPLYGGPGITSSNGSTNIADPSHKSTVTNYRLDLDWRLGDHDLQFGIDNDNVVDRNDGVSMTGPGYAWDYGKVDAGKPVTSGVYNVAAPNTQPGGEDGYIVSKYVFVTSASVKVAQRAQYIQDNWQVTPNLLLNLGLRNDQFTNYNPAGVAYLKETSPQWAPRLGFSWDVLGDSSLKVFGNVGRYYIAMPSSVALRAAGAPLFTNQYYTYEGIDPQTGAPLNIHPLATNAPGGAVPSNNSDGTPIDPKTVASTNLKPEYQDQFVLGMQQQINQSWVYGVTGIVNRMGRAIDDWGDQQVIYNQLIAQGADPATLKISDLNGGYLINPGETNTIRVANEAGGYDEATITREQMGFQKLKRKYYSLDMYLEHPFDGKWYGKVDYTFSRSYGNTEGPVQSSIGQGSSSQSATEQWDFSQLMEYAGGVQANDQKHQLRLYGYYQLAPEWDVGAQLRIASGYPKFCLGAYGVDEISKFNNYGNTDYHYCGGKPMSPGANGRTPWTHQLDLQVEYRPLWADKKLGFKVQVFNLLNEQNATQYDYGYGLSSAPEPTYMLTAGSELPRYVQFGVTYDW